MGSNFSASATLKGGSVSGKIATDLKHESGFTVKNIELNNKGTLSTQITLDKAVDNVQFSVNAKIQPLAVSNPKEETKIGATYTHDDFKADLVVSPLDPAAADFSACYKYDDIYVGGAAGIAYGEGGVDVKKYDFGIAYSKDNAVAALTVKNKLGNYQFSFYHKHSDSINFAATLGGKCSNADKNAALEFGGSYKVDGDTTVDSKLSFPNASTDSAKLQFNVGHRLNSSAKLGLSASLPVNLDGAGQFGLSLSLGV